MALPENLHDCPAMAAATEQANQLQAGLDQLSEQAARWQAGTDGWKVEFERTSPEEQLTEIVVDEDPVGNMYAQRDRYEGFARIAGQSRAEKHANIEHKQRVLGQKVNARQEACPKGPGRRLMCLGATTCRSAITSDGLPNGTFRESLSKRYGA